MVICSAAISRSRFASLLLPGKLTMAEDYPATTHSVVPGQQCVLRCSGGDLLAILRLIGRILRPVPQVVTCHLPCAKPECNQVCGRIVDVTRRLYQNHACRVCHRFGW